MNKDYTETIRTIDQLQERLDKIFERGNTNAVYHTEKTIADAISDNVRYFEKDRKADLAEIFYAVLEQIYERIVHPEDAPAFCNPSAPDGDERFPEPEMLMRDMMPLSWALCMEWTPPTLKGVICTYFQSFTEEESVLFHDLIVFLGGLFPEFSLRKGYGDFEEFWNNMATHRDLLRPETAEDKSELLTVLMRKRVELEAKHKA